MVRVSFLHRIIDSLITQAMKIKELKLNENEEDHRRCFKWKESLSRGAGDPGTAQLHALGLDTMTSYLQSFTSASLSSSQLNCYSVPGNRTARVM